MIAQRIRNRGDGGDTGKLMILFLGEGGGGGGGGGGVGIIIDCTVLRNQDHYATCIHPPSLLFIFQQTHIFDWQVSKTLLSEKCYT